MDEGYQVRLTEFLIYVCIYVSISVLLRNYIITICPTLVLHATYTTSCNTLKD